MCQVNQNDLDCDWPEPMPACACCGQELANVRSWIVMGASIVNLCAACAQAANAEEYEP